jgi:hypothetical protein
MGRLVKLSVMKRDEEGRLGVVVHSSRAREENTEEIHVQE